MRRVFRADLTAWYWASDGELRECVVTTVDDTQLVLDFETLEAVNVRPEDVLIERPEL